MGYSVRLIRVESHGEREVIVTDSDGMPPIEINMYVTRFRARSTSYRKNLAAAINIIYIWASKHGIDLVERMKSGSFLNFSEIDSFREHLRYRVDAPTHSPQSVEVAKDSFVCIDTYRRRAAIIINYLKFMGNVFAGTRKKTDPYANNMDLFISQFAQQLTESGGPKHAKQRFGLNEEAVKKR